MIIKTHIFMFSIFSRKFCPLWDNVEEYGRVRKLTGDNIIRRMHFANSINKDKTPHSEYLVLISFPRQQWLRQRPTMLRCIYIACLVTSYFRSSLVSSFSFSSFFSYLLVPVLHYSFPSSLSFLFSSFFSIFHLSFLSSQNRRHCRSWSSVSHWS